MSERKYIRSATMEVITNQIKDHLVEKGYNVTDVLERG